MNTLNHAFRLLFFIAATLLVKQTYAEGLDNQRRVFFSEFESSDYRLTLGTLKNVNANVVTEREIVLNGKVERITYEFDRSLSYQEAWAMLEARFGTLAGRELFSCSGLACGRSNDWANNRLGIKQLYGLDQKQKYRALVLAGSPNTYVALYFIQRGNKRIYAQVDTVVSTAQQKRVVASPSTIANILKTDGHYAVPFVLRDSVVGFDSQELQALADALSLIPISRFYVVGHHYHSSSEAEDQSASELASLTLIDSLVASGIKNERFIPRGLGRLAPTREMSGFRVELVRY